MKRFLLCLLCLCLVFPMCLISCGDEKAVVNYVYVRHVGEDYVIADIDGEGTIKIMCDAKGEGFEVFDTLKLKYRKADLLPEGGSFTALSGNPASYDQVLTKVVSIRKSNPEKGEPLYS